ncbi:MAG: hypothetical protein LBJ64_11920, partial [Deltaproteobacteria bacterium]|nr:hypothetical protein [Deltaproteobacteria bacterium]
WRPSAARSRPKTPPNHVHLAIALDDAQIILLERQSAMRPMYAIAFSPSSRFGCAKGRWKRRVQVRNKRVMIPRPQFRSAFITEKTKRRL